MIGMIPPTQWETVKESLKDITQNVLKTLFVPIPEEDNIQFRSCQVFGTMGSGKTSFYRFIAKKAIEHYGEENVNAIVSTSMDALIDNIDDKPIQLLCLDDAGLETQDVAKELVSKFTYIRHIFEQKRTNGVVIVLFAVQDYFLLEKKLRSTLHVEIFKHAPTNKHDITQVKGLLGEVAMKVLETVSKKVFEEHRYDWLSTCIAKTISGRVGYFYYDFIPSNDSVLRKIDSLLAGQKIDYERQVEKLGLRTVDDAFLKELRKEMSIAVLNSKKLQNKTKLKEHTKWFVDYYASEEKYSQDDLRILHKAGKRQTVGDAIISIRKGLTKKEKGDILERALCSYLNSAFQHSFPFLIGAPGQADLTCQTFPSLAINCKLFFNEDSSFDDIHCSPEHESADPWLALFNRELGLKFYHNQDRQEYLTLEGDEGLNGVCVGKFLEYVGKKYAS